MSDIIKTHRIKQYKNLIKLEQQQNPGQILQINNLQDNDIKELTSFIENYLNNCLRAIDSNDSILCASTSNVQDISNKNCDFIINVDSIVGMDFLKNGIKAGNPIISQFKKEANSDVTITAPVHVPVNQVSNLPKIPESRLLNHSPSTSHSSLTKHHQHQSQLLNQQQSPEQILNFSYLLNLNLNKNFFRFETENFNMFKVKLVKKPYTCSLFDYEQISLEIKPKKSESINQILTNNPAKSKYRYLNSRAIFDRLLKHFNHALKKGWPSKPKPMSQPVHRLQIIGESSQLENINEEELKKCYLKNNQIIVSFKWNGNKVLKDLTVNLFIDLAIRIDAQDAESVSDTINESIYNILKQFLNDSRMEPISGSVEFQKFLTWFNASFNSDQNFLYLRPTFVHLWSLNTKLVKFNLVKFFVWLDSARAIQQNLNCLNDLFQLNLHYIKQNIIMTIQNTNSPLFTYFKLLQLFICTCYSTLNEDPSSNKMPNMDESLDTEMQFDNEDLLINLVLIEISSAGSYWSSESIFERLWSCLIKLRYFLFNSSSMPDPFSIYSNQLPKFYLKCIGFYNLSDPSSSQIIPSIQRGKLNSLKVAYETTMRVLLTKVITEEIDHSKIERPKSVENPLIGSSSVSPVLIKDLNKQSTLNQVDGSNVATNGSSLSNSQLI